MRQTLPHRHSKSSRQAGPVSENQICQSKYHIQFCGLFSQPSVSGLPVSEPALDHSENVLDLCPDGGFFVLTAVDFISDFPAIFVPQYGFFPLFSAKITAVAIDGCFLTAEQLCRHRYILNIRGGDFQGVYQSRVLVHADMGFISKVPSSISATCANSFSCIPLRISRFRNRPSVSPSGT